MRIGFVLPSCNCNIVLTKEDVEKLLRGEYIFIRPDKELSHFVDERGVSYTDAQLYLECEGPIGEYAVQYLGICMEKED